MDDWEKIFPGQRRTHLRYQTLGKNGRIYPWIITQNAEGAVIKMTEEQMNELVRAYLDWSKTNGASGTSAGKD